MSGLEIIEWAVRKCAEEKVPPTDNAIVRMIRFHLIDVSDVERQRRKAGRVSETQADVKLVEEFLKLAEKIAKRDSWFIGGFLGAVWEEWNEKHPNKRLG